MQAPKEKKPTPGVHDKDLDLGYILHHADAPRLGAHPFVSDLLTPKPRLVGRAKKAQALLTSHVAGSGATHLDANNSGGLQAEPVTGETSKPSVPTDTGVGSRQTNTAAAESDTENERKQ